LLVRLRVIAPVFPLGNVGEAQLPGLLRVVDALKEALALFFLRQMEKELDDARSVSVEMFLQAHDRVIPLTPQRTVVTRLVRDAFRAQDLRMHSRDQHFLIVRSIEDADPPPFGEVAGGPPEKIVPQFDGSRMFEAEYVATLRIDARHHVLDDAVLPRRVHRLEDQQKGITIGCVKKLLQRAQSGHFFGQQYLIVLLRLVDGLHVRRPFLEIDLVAFAYAEILPWFLHRRGHPCRRT
jgi:hypothetical protein